MSFGGHDIDSKKKVGLRTPLTAYDVEMVCDIILFYEWLAENNVLINPRRHGLIFPDNGRLVWVDGLLPKAHTHTSMVQGMPIEVLEGITPPLQPSEAPGTCMSKKKYQDMVSQWKCQEKATILTAHILGMGLTVNQDHPRMGFPDMPGLAANKLDPLTENDVDDLVHSMREEKVEVNYIKGFVQSGDPMSGQKVEKLRERILTTNAFNVFKEVSGGSPPKRG